MRSNGARPANLLMRLHGAPRRCSVSGTALRCIRAPQAGPVKTMEPLGTAVPTDQEFRELFAANPLPMWIYDRATLEFLAVNDATVERYGYSRDEFLAMTLKDIHLPEDDSRLLTEVHRPRGPWKNAGSWQHRIKSGDIIDVDITSHTITFAGRSAALVVAQDVTERKLAEHGQRASEDRYRTLFEYAPDGIMIADRAGRYLDVNSSACRMLGYSRDELVGRHASDIVTPAEMQHIEPALALITSTGDYQREWQFRRKDGSVFSAGVIVRVLPDGNLLAMMRDLTERDQATEALQQAEERMRFALESAKVGIWDMDHISGVLSWSPTIEAQYGLQPGTFPGTFPAFLERIHPDDRQDMLATVERASAQGSEFTEKHRALWPDGTVRWLEGIGRVVLDKTGKPIRAIGISLDVTDRRVLEEQFQQAQKMEAIGRLAGGVAHDFNNLLTVILGNCELLRADLKPDDLHQMDVGEIQRAALSAASLTQQLLAFSRKEIIQPTLLNLNDVVTGMRVMVGRLIGEDVKIMLGLRSDVAPVMADRGQVEQIILNLSVNARDAMPRGGTLTIETANVELDENYTRTHLAVRSGAYVRLTVTDTGTGMTPEVQARLFEPFFTTKEVGRGTGLGLATVFGVVNRSGGTVNVYSELGRGTSFNVYFPKAGTEAIVAAVTTLVAHPTGGSETVLVVEDSDALRGLTKKLLERQGFTVLVASNSAEAIQTVEANPAIDLLLSDVVMPGASGPELAEILAKLHPGLKVVYMSGYTEDTIVHLGVLNPGIAFLHKPFTADALGRKIREALEGPS